MSGPETEYQRIISEYDWEQLEALWDDIQAGNTPEWQAGKAFEYLILRAFQLDGAKVRWPYVVEKNVEQIDGAIHISSFSCLLECKDQSENINIEPIAKLRNQLLRRPAATVGLVFSRKGFTQSARVLVRYSAPQTILLWSGPEIDKAIQKRYMREGLIAKYRYCVEYGIPYYNIIGEFEA